MYFVIERIGRFCTDYAQCLVDSTILGKRNDEFVDRRAAEKAEVVEADLIRELAEDIATAGRPCASCPEMDNPDSYISHLQSALRWHDEHVPRPTNPRNTCVVLQGEKPPEEVLFVREGGGVAHYLPDGAGTCRNIAELNREGVSSYFFVCSECGLSVHASLGICETNYPFSKPDGSTDLRSFNSNGKYEFERCPRCGRKVTE